MLIQAHAQGPHGALCHHSREDAGGRAQQLRAHQRPQVSQRQPKQTLSDARLEILIHQPAHHQRRHQVQA